MEEYEKNHASLKNDYSLYLLIFFTALIIRFIYSYYAYSSDTFLFPDSYDYIRLATTLSEYWAYGIPPEIFRVPLYPLFLALIKFIFPSFFFIAVLIIQAVIDSLSALFVSVTAARLFAECEHKLIPLTAGLFYALSPLCIQSSASILSETLFSFFLVVFLLLISKPQKTYLYYVVNGIFMAVLIFTRAVFLPLSILFLIYFYIESKCARKVLLCAVSCYILIFGWSVRNYLETGFDGFSSVSSINTYRYNACALETKLSNKSFLQTQEDFDKNLSVYTSQRDQADFASKHGWKLIGSHPFAYSYIHFKTSLNSLLPSFGDFLKPFGLIETGSGTLAVINSQGIFAGVMHYFKGNTTLLFIFLPFIFILILEYFLAMIGAGAGIIRYKNPLLVMLALSALYFIFVGGPASTPRFRMPAEPIIFIFASYGIYVIARKLSSNAG